MALALGVLEMNVRYLALGALASISTAALAQSSATPAAPVQATPAVLGVVAAPVTVPTLRAGTPVSMRVLDNLTTKGKKLKAGDRFQLTVVDPVVVNGMVAIPAQSVATGEVTSVRNKGMWGKSGAIEARVLHVKAYDRTIRCAGAVTDKGTTGTAGVVGAIVFLPIAGFFTTGTSAVIPAGMMVNAFIDEDVVLANGAPVMAVTPSPFAPAPAAPVPVAAPAVLTPVAVKN